MSKYSIYMNLMKIIFLLIGILIYLHINRELFSVGIAQYGVYDLMNNRWVPSPLFDDENTGRAEGEAIDWIRETLENNLENYEVRIIPDNCNQDECAASMDRSDDESNDESDDELMQELIELTESKKASICLKVAPKRRMMYRYVRPDPSNLADPIGINFYGPDCSIDLGRIHGTDEGAMGTENPYVYVEFQTAADDKCDLEFAYEVFNGIYTDGRYWRGPIVRGMVEITNIYITNRQLYDLLLPIYGDLLTLVELDKDHNFIYCI